MKKCLIIFLLLAHNTQAETIDETVNSACLKQAITLVQKMKADIYSDMSKEQEENIVRMSTDSCKQQFTATETQQVISQAAEEEDDTGTMDWFTDKILNSEAPDKDGNKRLKKMQRK